MTVHSELGAEEGAEQPTEPMMPPNEVAVSDQNPS
jgi:hypothetical protein